MTTSPDTVAGRLRVVEQRIAAACERAGRDPAEVTLIAVSKGQPLDAIREALDAGARAFGESRTAELEPKATEAARWPIPPRWHFIGHLQRNKVRETLPLIDVLHSVDSPALVEVIAREQERRAAGPAGAPPPLPCYLEVNIAGESAKGGVTARELPALLQLAGDCPGLRVLGLMTVAPMVAHPREVRPVFAALRDLARAHGLDGLSMGMTGDFEVAIEEGATAVRVGRAIFGARG